MAQLKNSRASSFRNLALATVESLTRPQEFEGTVEIAVATEASRSFPTRVTESLGVCLKFGPAHQVEADGRSLEYPANAVCVRPPGCVWSTANTGHTGFISLDLARVHLPADHRSRPMMFVGPDVLGDLRSLATLLGSRASRLQKDEAISALIARMCASEIILSREKAAHDRSIGAVHRARCFLEANIVSNPSLDEVARASGMNKHVLVRMFRKRFGTTPHAYVLMTKIEQARTMLAQGVPASEVANALNFADQAHFGRTFHRLVGLAPGAYQRRVRSVRGPHSFR